MASTSTATQAGLRQSGRNHRARRVGAAASGLALALTCGATAPAGASPSSTVRTHVAGQLLPVDGTPGVYWLTGGLVGTYTLLSERITGAWIYWDTSIRAVEGTEVIKGCVDQNHNGICDPSEPSGELRLTFTRVASFDNRIDRLIESNCVHAATTSSGSFSGGFLRMRDVPIAHSDQIRSMYAGDLELTSGEKG